MRINCNRFLLSSSFGVLLAAAAAAPAYAQDVSAPQSAEESEAEAVVVTGSRIRGIDPIGSPVVGLSREDMELSAGTTTTELLSELPQVFNLGATDASFTAANNQNANRTFGTGVNLRGLGTESTLTLLDGRRLPAAGTQSQYFDPSVIPTLAIGRLEVLADGSSGIYGSDAVGGVVNILLRRNYNGVEASGRIKFADGFEEYQGGAVAGKNWGSGSFMIAGEYNKRGMLMASERSFYTDDMRPFGGPDLRSTFSAPGNITVAGVNYAIPEGDGVGLTAGDFVADSRNLQSAYVGAGALPQQERYGFASTFNQDLTDTITFSAQGVYAHREGVFATPAMFAQFDVPTSNPFYVNPGAAGERVTVAYSFINELGTERNISTQEFAHITGGLDAELGGGWSANAFFAYGENRERSFNRQIDNAALLAALADTNPATAFNPFSSTGNNNAATMAAIAGGSFRVDTNYFIKEYGASVDGPLFSLPGGDVKIALGVARQDITWQDRAPFVTSFDRSVDSLFGELFLPLLSGVDGPELNVSAALRHDSYSDVGSTTNPKFGVNFKPVSSLTLRGSYGTSFRAPTLSDTGLPFNTYQTMVDSNNVQQNILFLRGGNAGLRPETATTWSLGADLEPVDVPGLRLSVSYYNVDYSNRIAAPGNDGAALQKAELAPVVTLNPSLDVVNAILAGGLFSPPPASPSDVYAIVDGRKLNIGRTKTEGLEFIGDYRATESWGSWRLGVNATKILNFRRSIVSGQPLVDVVNTINNPAGFVGRAYVGADLGGFSGTVFVSHYGSYDNDTIAPIQDVPAHTEVDLALRYTVDSPFSMMKGVTFSLDVQDLFDNDPPFVQAGTLAFDGNAHNAVGRTISIGVRTSF